MIEGTKYFCDHCRKELTNKDIFIISTKYGEVDLCNDCVAELNKFIGEFINKDVIS